MKYFLDTEFHEYGKKNFPYKSINTIELISIGMVTEDNREYYAISKDFDLKSAWNNEWLRENVLINIWKELIQKERYAREFHPNVVEFTEKGMKNLIKWNGKTNKQIAEEVQIFTGREVVEDKFGNGYWHWEDKPEFYGYYADYDWVVFSWLFGSMMKLPNGFPKFCLDLKQIFDEKLNTLSRQTAQPFDELLSYYKSLDKYPKQINEHNALADSKWNLALYKFLSNI